MSKSISKVFYFILGYSVLPVLALAQQGPAPGGSTNPGPAPGGGTNPGPAPATPSAGSGRLENPLENQTLMGLLMDILDVIMVFAVPIIVFFIIYAGFLYVTAQGNEETVKKAHRALLYSVVGGVIILGAQLLLSVISGTIASF